MGKRESNIEKPIIDAKTEDEDQLVPSEPKLNHIYKTLGLLDGYTEWKKSIPEKIGPWENSLDLFNNVQKVVIEQISDKIPTFKKGVSSLKEIPNQYILDTVANNWPEDIEDDVPEFKTQRRKVLLSVAAHVVKHMETTAYQEIIASADEKDLKKLGLNSELREVTTKLLDATMRADNLFIRFLAFSGLTSKPPREASSTRFFLPEDKSAHTINDLFPRDTQYISRKFKEIAEMPIEWENIPGGEIFKEYLLALSESFLEQSVEKIDEYYKKVTELYKQSTLSDFPILIIPPEYSGGYHKPPYFDPELKITLKSPECLKEAEDLSASQKVISQELKKMGYDNLAKNVMKKEFTVVNSIGDYGVNLMMKTTGQMGESVGMVFLGEQRKVQDMMAAQKNFRIGNTKEQYSSKMSLFVTSFHEYCHFRDGNDPTIERLGEESSVIINEVVAEQFYRQFLPEMIKQGAIEGTEEGWASAALENSLEELMDKPKIDPYYYMAVYTLNRLFEEGIVVFDFKTGTATIKDVDAFYTINRELSKELMILYDDETMTPAKARKWIKNNCTPNGIVEKISRFIKKEGEINEEEPTATRELPKSPETGSVKIFPWEVAWIKKGDPKNQKEVETLMLIDAQPEVEKFMVGDSLKKEDFRDEGFYAICGEKDATEGFVWIYELEEDVFRNLKESKLMDPTQLKNVWEVSFARLVDKNLSNEELKKKVKKLIPSAIRQICSLFKKNEGITIAAYNDPENVNSEGILTNACFEKKGETFYDTEAKEKDKKDNFWVLNKDRLNRLLLKEQTKFEAEARQ